MIMTLLHPSSSYPRVYKLRMTELNYETSVSLRCIDRSQTRLLH